MTSSVETIVKDEYMPGKLWTQEEITTLIQNYSWNPKVYDLLPDRSYQAVSFKAFSLNLKKDGRGDIRSLEATYFDKWSPNMAWALGFLVADGNLFHQILDSGGVLWRITYTQKEREILEDLCDELGVPHKHIHRTEGWFDFPGGAKAFGVTHRVAFTNRHMFERLLELGVMPNKSLQLKKVSVHKKYFSHFLRGYFDGDGCFSWSTQPRQRVPRISFTSGSRQFLKWIEAKISKYYGLPGGRIRRKPKGSWNLRYRKNTSLKLMSIMYFDKEATLFLRRKKESFLAYLDYHGLVETTHETPEARLEYFNDLVKI